MRQPHPVDPYDILYLVSSELGVTPLALLMKDRHAPLPLARQLSAWLLVKWLGLPIGRVAVLLEVSYSTVAYYLRNVERRRRNGELSDLLSRLSKAV